MYPPSRYAAPPVKCLGNIFKRVLWRRSRRECLFVVAILFILCNLVMLYMFSTSSMDHDWFNVLPETMCHAVSQEYKDVLQAKASRNKTIILSFVDEEYMDLTLNFHESSLLPLHIHNYLFLSTSKYACDLLKKHNLDCFQYEPIKASSIFVGGGETRYGSNAFKMKMAIRTGAILDALVCNYAVLHTDVDIVFFQNPFPHISCEADCDIQPMDDGRVPSMKTNLNAGFVYLKPTLPTIAFYRKLSYEVLLSLKYDDQELFNLILKQEPFRSHVKVKVFDNDKFQCGQLYFEDGNRNFATDPICKNCVMVHNNWIVSKAAKIYRFKENLLWTQDDDQYFSNPNEKYIVYENPLVYASRETRHQKEMLALRNAMAIGQILNRTVILPAFHCFYGNGSKDSLCPLNEHVYITKFNNIFGGKYREHVFLNHPKVPDETKNDQSNLQVILTTDILPCVKNVISVHKLIPTDTEKGANSQEILDWFQQMASTKVLRFHSLYNAFSHFVDEREQNLFNQRIDEALTGVGGNYRQYDQVPQWFKHMLVTGLYKTIYGPFMDMMYGWQCA